MASSKHTICSLVLLVTAPTVLTYPIAHAHAHVGTPELGALSFAELTQHTFRRILELGFLRGVLVSLLVLGSLVCLLICVLSILATYLGRHDAHHQSQQVEKNNGMPVQEKAASQLCGKEKGDIIGSIHDEHIQQQQQQLQLRQPLPAQRSIIRYILGQNHHPVIRINTIHTPNSSLRNTKSNVDTLITTTASSPRSPSTPKIKLRSALSKSPPPRRPRFSTRAQSFFFGQRRSSPQSPKSVRWADELEISFIAPETATIEMEFETDIGLSSPSPLTEGCDSDSNYFRP